MYEYVLIRVADDFGSFTLPIINSYEDLNVAVRAMGNTVSSFLASSHFIYCRTDKKIIPDSIIVNSVAQIIYDLFENLDNVKDIPERVTARRFERAIEGLKVTEDEVQKIKELFTKKYADVTIHVYCCGSLIPDKKVVPLLTVDIIKILFGEEAVYDILHE